MESYLNLLKDILENGTPRKDRTGVGTIGVFGRQLRFDLSNDDFPLLTTKKLHWKSIVHELLWFLSGDTNIKYLRDNGVTIWDEWADENGNLGPVYGHQWRNWGGKVDQIANVVKSLRENPFSRRHIVTAWNPSEVDDMALPPCHCLFQFHVTPGKHRHKLSLQLYQRSCDVFLGVPFNIASYALLLRMMAQVCGFEAYEFIHTYGDLHLYSNHVEQAKLQLTREPKPLPKLILDPHPTELEEFNYNSFILGGYEPHPAIKAPVAV